MWWELKKSITLLLSFRYSVIVEGHSNMPQTGQNRIGYLIIGFIIILSMGILIYIESYQKISNK